MIEIFRRFHLGVALNGLPAIGFLQKLHDDGILSSSEKWISDYRSWIISCRF